MLMETISPANGNIDIDGTATDYNIILDGDVGIGGDTSPDIAIDRVHHRRQIMTVLRVSKGKRLRLKMSIWSTLAQAMFKRQENGNL